MLGSAGMLHFPAKLQTTPAPGSSRKSEASGGLNATQQLKAASSSNPMFLKIEEELHDARRVRMHGQEDDLRYALDMVINRVTELSTMLGEAYKIQADLEVQLNVAKSNLQLVIANNEMLEDVLKNNTSGNSRDVGWRRTSNRNERDPDDPRASLERSQSIDYIPPSTSNPEVSPPTSAASQDSTSKDTRFFKFRFSSTTTTPQQRPATRPSTPQATNAHPHHPHHLNSPSMPSLPTPSAVKPKELEELEKELEKEREAKKKVMEEKVALEAELESLSQALFEEANNMVATERKKRADAEDELKEMRMEQEAIKSALRLIENENMTLRGTTLHTPASLPGDLPSQYSNQPSRPPSRSSSEIAVKSRPASLDLTSTLPALPPSPSPASSSSDYTQPSALDSQAPDPSSQLSRLHTQSAPPVERDRLEIFSPEEDSFPTPKVQLSLPPTPAPHETSPSDPFGGPSPWADVSTASGGGFR